MEKLETPYYLIEEEKLNYDINLLLSAMSNYWSKNTIVPSYSFKTNSLPWVLNHMKNSGFWAEVVSQDEYLLARKIGFADSKIVYNGPIKNKETFFKILTDGGYVNIDSTEELEWLDQYEGDPIKVGIRVNVDLRNWLDPSKLGDYHGGRFGFCYENGSLAKTIERIRMNKQVSVVGLHMHQSIPSRSPEAFAALAQSAVEIAKKYKLLIEYIDMGGGYFGGRDDMPNFNDYFSAICHELKRAFDPNQVKLIAEPGVSLVSRGFSFVTMVKDTKDVGNQRFLITDGSRLYLNPQVTRHSYPHHVKLMEKEKEIKDRGVMSSQIVTGSSCMEYDRLFEIKNYSELKHGDYIIYDNAGGYTICLAPMFINYWPSVYVKKLDGTILMVREKWTNEEMLQKCIY